ncbi:MAG: AAA family ATPase [Flavobacteriales bacterium]|jgi:magnesium chelatase subunit I
MSNKPDIHTLGQLRKSGYRSQSIREELRNNLIHALTGRIDVFSGIIGYEETVIPDLQRAILSGHSINLLGLRGQAKTRMARNMTRLLDEWIPVVAGSEVNDDPLLPVSRYALDQIALHGEDTPVDWLHRDDRYVEKLATPDVTVADLIGDVDPIKAANLKLSYSDERVIHFGLVPRSNRCIFVINELPDLQARIQVALFNILQEGDIQIRGFQLRLPLDIQFIFTANPEDYTNRGSIITPLKDRIQSQILTHYPKSIEVSREITLQEARIREEQRERVRVPALLSDLVEQVAFEARDSEYVDQKSGVSARLTISAYENLVASAERRTLVNGETSTTARISDLLAIIPAITGKVELVYEGEQEGPQIVALRLMGAAIRRIFPQLLPNPETFKRKKAESPYTPIIQWFSEHELEVLRDSTSREYATALYQVPVLSELAKKYGPGLAEPERLVLMEFILHGLAEYSLIGKSVLDSSIAFGDLMGQIFSPDEAGDDE